MTKPNASVTAHCAGCLMLLGSVAVPLLGAGTLAIAATVLLFILGFCLIGGSLLVEE